MHTATVVHSVIHILLTVWCVVLTIQARRLKRRSPPRVLSELRKDLVELSGIVGDHTDALGSLAKRVTRLNARQGMREAREKKAEPPPEDFTQQPGESADDWKKRVRLAIHRGKGPQHH